ncbi:ferritin-like metal-binding protein YciE [Agrobacterium sp. RC10-4-1]|uniref:Arc family DNA-binding protein n=1 Tax=Agrobacterium sp. RC10-4-1 TaxID=2587039 RepID=UPI0015FD076C|nr:Arc family DNA-binding protein [Agrobacterium sp. RC10-4-1]MBA8799150.1 ferritin-like metal-binding protein YciE [Agrobacterium sp. RC10-4-1]
MAKNDVQVNFRMPAELKAKLEEAAFENNRSLTSEIVERLQQSFDPLIVNVRNGADMMDEIAKIAEKVVRTIREEERKAGLPPLENDPVSNED